MEWVRACCKSKWRLTRGSDRLRAGRYWFCGDDVPFYPGVHNLGSRDWTSDERNPWPVLGEYDGEREWDEGDPPARRPLPVLVGTPDCIRYGESPGLAIVTDVDESCGKILPNACYPDFPSTRDRTNVLDCVFAKLVADVLNDAYTDLPAAATRVANYMPPATIVTTFPQPNDLIPAGVIAAIDDTVVIFLTGTTNFNQLAAQGLYFGLGPEEQGDYSASILYENAAMAIADIINANGLGGASRFVLTGHSYGGAVCMVLAARMLVANPHREIELLTLGAPAPGDERLHLIIQLLRQIHYVNELDPIPHMPPGGFQFPWLLPLVGLALIAQWAKFERAPKSKLITRDGQFRDIRAEDLPADFMNLMAAAIAAGIDAPNFTDHRTDWYSYYLCLACKCVARPCVRPAGEEIAFDVILEGLQWTDGVTVFTENFAANMEYQALDDVWVDLADEGGNVLITPLRGEFGNIESFLVEYHIEDEGPLDHPFTWQFTLAEMLVGIDTTTLPAFADPRPGYAVVSLDRLVIPNSFAYPPIDGDGGDGFEEIHDGDGLP